MKPKFLSGLGRVGIASLVGGTGALAGLAAWGGVELSGAASASMAPINYSCSTTAAAITWQNGGDPAGLWLNANAGNSKAIITQPASNGDTSLYLSSIAVPGEKVLFEKATYVVTSFNPSTGQAGITPAIAGLKATEPANTKVDIEPTDGTNNTTAYSTSYDTNYSGTDSGCTVASGAPVSFYPTTNNIAGSQTGTGNGAGGLENGQKDLNFQMTFNTDSNYSDNTASDPAPLSFKTATFNGTGYTLSGGKLGGTLKTSNISGTVGINGAVVCTVDQMGAVGGGANPYAVCDGGTSSSVSPGQAALELAQVESTGSGTGSDGSPLIAIYTVFVGGSFSAS